MGTGMFRIHRKSHTPDSKGIVKTRDCGAGRGPGTCVACQTCHIPTSAKNANDTTASEATEVHRTWLETQGSEPPIHPASEKANNLIPVYRHWNGTSWGTSSWACDQPCVLSATGMKARTPSTRSARAMSKSATTTARVATTSAGIRIVANRLRRLIRVKSWRKVVMRQCPNQRRRQRQESESGR